MELIIIIITGLLVYFIFNSIHTKKQQKLQRQKELFIYQQNEQKLKLEFEKRKNDITDFVNENEILIKKLIQEYPLSSKSFNNYNSYSNYKIKLSNFITSIPHKEDMYSCILEIPTLRNVSNIHESIENDIKLLNNQFVKNELLDYKSFFNEVLSYPLDIQQQDAIVRDEDNTLVIAGAGCGKTTTVQGKINYILDKKLALPNEILVMSFSKDSTNDLKKKLDHLGVEIRTFHSLAYKIIKLSKRNPDIIEPNRAKRLLDCLYSNLIKDENFMFDYWCHFSFDSKNT